jgi:hypothetical protein
MVLLLIASSFYTCERYGGEDEAETDTSDLRTHMGATLGNDTERLV